MNVDEYIFSLIGHNSLDARAQIENDSMQLPEMMPKKIINRKHIKW